MTFELRIYTPAEGRLDDVLRRFRDHTDGLFRLHGMHATGYWVGDDGNLYYVLRHEGDAKANWAAFLADDRWLRVRDTSEAEGRIVESVEAIRMTPTDFSASV